MVMLLGILLIIFICWNIKLEKKVDELTKKINSFPDHCEKCGKILKVEEKVEVIEKKEEEEEKIDIRKYLKDPEEEKIIESKIEKVSVKKVVKKQNDTEIKNSLILIIGSCLLVLAAILFLTTTWNTTTNSLKTIVLMFMLIIFYGSSNIAKNYLKIPQTAKAFYYISLAYIPIVLLSIFIFKLFGDYLSYIGDGKFIYLLFSSIIVSVIYYYSSKKETSRITSLGSIVFSYLAVIFLFCLYKEDILLIASAISIYSLVLSLLYYKGYYYLDKDIHLYTVEVFATLALILNFVQTGVLNHYVNAVINFVNIYLLVYLINGNKDFYSYIYPAYIMLLVIDYSHNFNDILITQLLLVMSFACIYIYDCIKESGIKESSYIEIMFGVIFLLLSTISNNNENTLPVYIVLFILSVVSYMYYYSSKKIYSFCIFNISFLISIFSLFMEKNYSYVLLGFIYLLILVLSELVKEEKIKEIIYYISYLAFFANSILIIYYFDYLSIILFAIFIGYNIYQYINNNNTSNKIIAYVYLDATILSSLHLFGNLDINSAGIAFGFITIGLALIEGISDKIRNKENRIYLLVHTMLTFILLNCSENSIYCLIMLLLLSMSFIVYIYYYQLEKDLIYIPIIFLLPSLYFKNQSLFYITYYVSLTIIFVLEIVIYQKKEDRNIIWFYIFAICHMLSCGDNKYVNLALISSGTFVSYIVKDNKLKDLFKFILSIEALVFVKFLSSDLLTDYNILVNYVPYFVWLIYVTRFILSKYIKEYKIVEYIGSILLNMYILFNYANPQEGISIIMFLIILVIVSYMLKYGPYFLTSLIFIVFNFFSLTQEFWLSLAWWVYVLFAGLILIAFGVFNEMNEKKEQSKKLIEDLKNKLDI